MRSRIELLLGVGLLLLLGIAAAALGARRARTGDEDPRRSTYLPGPEGAMGFAEALRRLGMEVERLRRRPDPQAIPAGAADSTLLIVLGPSMPLRVREARALVALPADLLVAGPGAAAAIRCLGYDIVVRLRPAPVLRPAGLDSEPAPAVRSMLAARETAGVVDSSEAGDADVVACAGPAVLAVDTLLRVAGGGVAALRLEFAGGRRATLVADDGLFANRALRTTAAGPIALGLVVPRYRHVVVDEFHHGFAAAGSLAGALLAWSLRSPWGWAIWQLALVGLVALLASGIRFGPVQRGLERRRRSPLEHVRALATALAAARGHEVAVDLLLQGLRRRLSREGQPIRADQRAWLADLARAVRTERGRSAAATLDRLTRRPVDARGVLQAAHAVEDVWEELKP